MIRIQIYQNKKYFCVADILKAIGSKTPAVRFLKATPETQYRKFNVTTGNNRVQEVSFATAAGLIPLLQNTGTTKAFEIIAYLQAETGVKIDAPKVEAQPDGISGELIRYKGVAVRYKYEGGKFWFAAMDACVWLNLENVSRACENIPEKYKQNGKSTKDYTAETGCFEIPNTYSKTPRFYETESQEKRGGKNILWLDENGLMFLVLGSNNPAVIELKCFLIETILPQLKEQGVAFVSEEREIEYLFETAEKFAQLVATAEMVNDFENQKRFKEDYKNNWVRKHFPKGKPGKTEFVKFAALRSKVYKLYSDKELQALTTQRILSDGRGVLPKAVTRNNILWNEWYAPGSALPAAYRDLHGYLDLSDKEKARIDKEIRLIQAYAKRVELYPCARGGAKLITCARESDETARARLVKIYREQNKKIS